MSTSMNTQRQDFRWRLLSTVSATALLVSAYGAQAADADRPLLWIELGGQLNRLDASQEPFVPPGMDALKQDGFESPLTIQKSPLYSIDSNGRISFQPQDSHWIFSASIQYGRSASFRRLHQEKPNPTIIVNLPQYPFLHTKKYATQNINVEDATSRNSESHVLLDFQAGKDVGLGMFGSSGSSSVNLGVRIAQLREKSSTVMHITPDVRYRTTPISSRGEFIHYIFYSPAPFHHYGVVAHNRRGFEGIGPSISWNASAPLAGDLDTGEIVADWGINAALLFGRQKYKGSEQTKTATFNSGNKYAGHSTRVLPHTRARSITVPNVGGFAGMSFRIENFKMSAGYRADFFFGAVDGGIDARKNENRGFFGPFASVSVGLGD